ncbi:MAG: choice-of-anchor Q domain-containing protein [Dokdonella sp.]
MNTVQNLLVRSAIVLCACLGIVKPAAATEFCIQTLNDLTSTLQLATLAELGDNDVTMKLVAQTYTWNVSDNASRTYASKNRLRILGGYSANCASRTINPDNTVINLTGSTDLGFRTNGDAEEIEGITFRSVVGISFGSTINCTNIGKTVRLARNKFETGAHGLYLEAHCHALRAENNLFNGGGGTFVEAYFTDGQPVSAAFVNNTFVNAASGLELYRYSNAEPLTVSLYNNVIWGNGSFALALGSGSAPVTLYAYHNTWTNVSAPMSIGFGNSTVNPLLTANFHLTEPGSPAINSGFNSVSGGLPGTDLAGGPRLIGSAVDRGAYESSVNNASAIEIPVTSSTDSGTGSLRAAILAANATAGLNVITFAMGSCPQFIFLDTPLPQITDSLWVSGYSAAGSSANTLTFGNDASYCVRVVGSGGSVASAFRVPATVAPDMQLLVQGLAIGGFGDAVVLGGGSNHIISGNHFGPGLTSFLDMPRNGYNVRLGGAVANVLIGGNSPSSRNTIAGATTAGIRIAGTGAGNQAINNYIGSGRAGGDDPDGDTGNAHGIELASNYALVRDNLIGLNSTGILITGEGNQIESNRIGLKALAFCFVPPCAPGYDAIPNTGGITLNGGATNNLMVSNIIAKNVQHGIAMATDAGFGNWVLANNIHSNGTLGIDLYGPSGAGPDPISLNVAVGFTGPNGHMNYPVLDSAAGGAFNGRITGSLSSHNGAARIDLFASAQCDPSGYGEGERFIGSTTTTVSGASVLPPQNGIGQISVNLTSSVSLVGKKITATATDNNGNTSEFSTFTTYQCDGIFAHGFDDAVGSTCGAQ